MNKPMPTLRGVVLSYACAFGVWFLICALITVQQGELESDLRNPQWTLYLFALMGIRFLVFALLTPPVFYIVRRFPIERERPLRGILAYALGAVPFAICFMLIRVLVAPVWDEHLQRFARYPITMHNMLGVIFGTFGDQIAVYITLVGGAHAYAYYEQMRSDEVEKAELQQALAASELQSLKSQLHPHFLFNTLHGVATLMDSDRARAKTMLIKLSDLLRAALRHGSTDLIRLDEELEFVRAYVELEKMRLGERLETRWSIEPGTGELLVPQLILQPLVENAIRHGIACCRTGGWLEISSRKASGALELEVENSVGGKSQPGMGVGMSNTRSRLMHLYADEATFSFSGATGEVATATLRLPVFISHAAALAGAGSR
ncbi:MAG: histidine kinase [Candidatus Acidiferrales bacterium]